MKKVYIGISFKKSKELSEVLTTLKEVLLEYDMEPLVFVDEYVFSSGQEKEMMAQATKDISESSLMIAELTEKAIGVGLEVGYAAALKIPVLYLKHESAEYSKTVGGLSDSVISYKDSADLKSQLIKYLIDF
jgi:nucleoside 2-deoxyribosyltransferase